jgi:ribosomal protein S18 acetylase RimI-like enzyme
MFLPRSSLTINVVSCSELKPLQQIARETFYETFADLNTPENMADYLETQLSQERLLAELQDPDSTTYFIRQDGDPIGYLKLNTGSAQTEFVDPGGLEIQRIYVRKTYLGAGVGLLLLDHALQVARSKGLPYVWLAVWEKNPRAIRFYEKNGFVPFGSHIFRLGADEQVDIMMKRIL